MATERGVVTEVFHARPDASGVTPCCGKRFAELPTVDHVVIDPALVTCRAADDRDRRQALSAKVIQTANGVLVASDHLQDATEQAASAEKALIDAQQTKVAAELALGRALAEMGITTAVVFIENAPFVVHVAEFCTGARVLPA